MRHLDYQEAVRTRLERYLDTLKAKKANADKIAAVIAADPTIEMALPDFPAQAWKAMGEAKDLPLSRFAVPFSPRTDGAGRPVPNVTLKVPTGGGKTYLAIEAVSRIFGRYLNTNTGFVLWIVPNEAIYAQTLKHLKDRDHPYRHALDRAAAGRVRVLEKTDRLDARDVETNLCVMLLMLQSANRQTKESLRMFRDRGDVHGFTPADGEQQAHKDLNDAIPNLDAYDDLYPMVKDSLGNALRIVRPVMVLDEGHKAVAEGAYKTLYSFNPCFVLELTATPQDIQPRGGNSPREGRYANLLVEVTGRDLDREGMIKMPLNLDARQGTDWKTTLRGALDRLESLSKDAATLRAETGRYIRPIMLVQVERTGEAQLGGDYIHAEDVRDWLHAQGFDKAEIAVKTAETNDLNQPENLDLLSATNRVRIIITKQALQEGWDCPFAYVLCALAASSNLSAMTQLVGRILRQPQAEKTGVDALDECYVITHHAQTRDVVAAIKGGLESDGLGDLVRHITTPDASAGGAPLQTITRRPAFAKTEIALPLVLWVEAGAARAFDYETDILSRITWGDFDAAEIAEAIPINGRAAESQMQRITVDAIGSDGLPADVVSKGYEALTFDPPYAVRMIADIVPNPFVARAIVGRLLDRLAERGFADDRLGKLSGLIVDEMRRRLDIARMDRAERVFKDEVAAGHIQFRLRMDGTNWRMPKTVTVATTDNRHLTRDDGSSLQKSLFAPVYEAEMNADERKVAIFLDERGKLSWWHRNAARNQYGLAGWRRGLIYPDFVFAVSGSRRQQTHHGARNQRGPFGGQCRYGIQARAYGDTDQGLCIG